MKAQEMTTYSLVVRLGTQVEVHQEMKLKTTSWKWKKVLHSLSWNYFGTTVIGYNLKFTKRKPSAQVYE